MVFTWILRLLVIAVISYVMIRVGIYLLKYIWCACKETKKNMDQLIARNTGYSRPETSGPSDWDEQMRMHQQQMLIQQQIDEQCQRDMQWQFDENQRLFTEQQHRDMDQFNGFIEQSCEQQMDTDQHFMEVDQSFNQQVDMEQFQNFSDPFF